MKEFEFTCDGKFYTFRNIKTYSIVDNEQLYIYYNGEAHFFDWALITEFKMLKQKGANDARD